MTILITGASGFIGRHLARALEQAGHEVIRGTRPQFDFVRDVDPEAWQARLRGVDLAINAAGILREHGAQTFEAIHVRGPRALFNACAALGIKVIQISALGADDSALTPFHRTKKQADDALLALGIPCIVLQPSLVYGPGGASARLFTALASLPVIPLPGHGAQQIQPVHIGDLSAAVVAIVRDQHYPKTRLPVVGPAPTTLRDFLLDLRLGMGLAPAPFLPIPATLVQAAAGLAPRFGLLFDLDAWRMLERGNTADAEPLRQLLGRPPRNPAAFVTDDERENTRTSASLMWLLPLLRLAIALVWITAGIVSAGLYPVEDSLDLLERTGLTGAAAYVALYGAALLDIVLGVATLIMRRRALLWLAQMAVIVVYTGIITYALPEQWLHPYGPVVKNLPMLAALLLLYRIDR
jgi:uncharacterized protein YbjT (DUF2867 family)